MATIIQAKQLQFSYGSRVILKHINLTVNAGEIIGLIGVNGAGKTTLLNLLLGIRTPQQGQLTVFDQTPGTLAARQRIGSMLQGDLIVRGSTVLELLSLAAAQYTTAMSPTAVMAELSLTPLKNQLLTTLSGGQLRRVTFALALIGNPDLLFLDEPTVGMDTNAQQAFWHRIKALKAQGKTIIITSHYLPEIQTIADRIWLLKDGQLAFQGRFQTLQQQFQRTIIRCQTMLLAPTFKPLPGVIAVTKTGDTLQLTSDNGDVTLAALMPYLPQLHQLTITRESLADIFVHLTKEDATC